MNHVSFHQMIVTELGLCGLHVEGNRHHTIFNRNILADLTNQSPHALTMPNNKINVYTTYDTHLLIFTIYLYYFCVLIFMDSANLENLFLSKISWFTAAYA